MKGHQRIFWKGDIIVIKKTEIVHLFEKYKSFKSYSGGVDEGKITKAEKELGVTFPEEYRWFLHTYGEGGVLGVGILGLVPDHEGDMVRQTLKLRESIGLTPEYVVVQYVDVFFPCLNVNTGEIIYWYLDGIGEKCADTFFEFLQGEVQLALNDLEYQHKEMIKWMEQYKTPHSYAGGVSEEAIAQAEKQLGTIFPEQYRWFLRNYGEGGVLGIDICGLRPDGKGRLVPGTLILRKNIGLSPEYLVIEAEENRLTALNAKTGEQMYIYRGGGKRNSATDFFEYLHFLLQRADDKEWRKQNNK